MKESYLSKRLTAIVLATIVTTGLVTENVYAQDISKESMVLTKENYNEYIDNEEIKSRLIIPSTMEISKDEASDINAAIKKKIEEINNITIQSIKCSISQFGNSARAVVAVTSSDGRTGEGNIDITIVGEESKGDLIIPSTMEIYQDEASDINAAIKKKIEEINNITIQSIKCSISQFGNSASAVVEVTSSDGRSGEGDIYVTIVKRPNNAPKIEVSDKTIKVGYKFNPLDGVKATDVEDGDITDKIEVVENNVDTTQAGEYKVVYKVTDSQGASFKKEIKVKVEEKVVESTPILPQTGGSNSLWVLSSALTSIFSGMLINKKKRK